MSGRPQAGEAADFYWKYIDLVSGDDAAAFMEPQLDRALSLFAGISEERSLTRYAPGKWSIRQVLNHVTDTERAFAFRALWFGRGFDAPLSSYDQNVAAAGAEADRIPWSEHIDEFQHVRRATISLFRHLPEAAWLSRGVTSGHNVTVRAIAFLTAGHAEHHLNILRERYL